MITTSTPGRALFRSGIAIVCLGMSGAFAGTPNVYTQYEETGNAKTPRPIGKLFSSLGTCSASVISGNNIIVTAAHCCFNRSNNTWIGGWSFAPLNSGPTYPWASARVLSRWITVGDIQSDVCLITLGRNTLGQNVSAVTGWLGRSWDWPNVMSHHAVGYPGNIGGAATTQLCAAESFGSTCGEPNVLNMGCNMTFGASGGPWVWQYRRGNYVNSVVHGYTSAGCTGTFGQTFNGPRFTSTNIVPLCTAQGC